MKRSQGIALLVVLGALSVLAFLATAFATLTQVERAAARGYLDHVRARLLAHSGVEDGIARLREIAALEGFLDDTRWVYQDNGSPSFTLRDASGQPVRVRWGGKESGVSGITEGGTYGRGGDLYVLRVTDASSRINVNDGIAWGPDHSVSRNLRRILNVLGAQPTVNVQGLGDKILAGRPPGGYPHKADLFRALGLDREAFRRVRDFLTVASWSDPQVAELVPLSAAAEALSPVSFARPGGFYRHGHQRDASGELIRAPLRFFEPGRANPAHNAIWGRDSLHPRWIEIVSRSPVNVNAARREVLVALLVDLEGFFVAERRQDGPGGYAWAETRYTYDREEDACGFLYRTLPFTGPGGRSTGGVPAEAVADEILACRGRRPSPLVPGLDYARAPFGGPFRSWSQFHAFVDALVRGGLFRETRASWFWDYDETGRRVPSPVQLRVASQAIGDVLKANFNPNLHLNELNPNRNIFAHVDKTDLVVRSTEFCFTPMGLFEIESAGIVLRPGAGADALAGENQEVAVHRTTALVRLFDAIRHTSQRDFYAGEVSDRRGPVETNNNAGLETGPEPDNGLAPSETRAEGYLQLSTCGSNFFVPGERKPKNTLRTTATDPGLYPGAETSPAPSAGHLGSVIHAHFQLDHLAHHHQNRAEVGFRGEGFRLPQGAWTTVWGRRAAINRNWEDRTESIPPPYGPVDSTRAKAPDGARFRLVRSFSLNEGLPHAFEAAPSDLRLDGAYVERHSAFGYWIEENVSFNFNEGVASFWIKPAFFPEMSGKSRTLLSTSRYHAYAAEKMNLSPFALFYVPGHSAADGSWPAYPGAAGPFRPNSLAFGFGFSSQTGYNWEMNPSATGLDRHASSHAFAVTPTLNHEGREPDDGDPRTGGDGRFNFLRAHEWTHVAVTWSNPRYRLPDADTVRIHVNGQWLPGSAGFPHLYTDEHGLGQPFAKTPRWAVHSLQALLPGFTGPKWCVNTIRLGGEPSTLFDGVLDGIFPRNFSADATFDEFYLWNNRSMRSMGGLAGARALWARGRYYLPDDVNPEDALFTSAPVALPGLPRRVLPPAAQIQASLETMAGTPVEPAPPRPRVLGISWTEFGEDLDAGGPVVFDYAATPPLPLRPAGGTVADLWIEAGGRVLGPFRQPAYSPMPGSPEAQEVRYRVKLKAGGPRASGTVLLSSPVLDDVTIFFDAGAPEVLGWTND